MKKFLFTLAALMMAGSLSAEEYCFIDNFEVKADQLGTEIEVPLKAHLDCLVNAFDVSIITPEGLTITWAEDGEDCTVPYFNAQGKPKTVLATWAWNDDFSNGIAITGATVKSYVEVDGVWTYSGAPKWLPGDYEEMVVLTVEVAADFKGGDITVVTRPACGEDVRDNVAPKGQENYHTATITVEGTTPVIEDLTGEIVVGEPTEDGLVAISYNGTEDVTIVVTLNGEVVELADGMLQLAEGENTVVVTVSAQGYNDMVGTYNFTWTAPVVPEVTEAPTINWNPETFTVEAVGNGEVLMYVDGELVANPYTFDQTDVETTYTVTATAQEPGKEISDVATLTVTVPAKEVTPVDPDDHTVGYWLVTLDKNNEPVWTKLQEGQNGYTKAVELQYEVYGRYNHDTGYRGNVPFYFMIDGVRYGADEFEAATVIGDAMENPLSEADGYYTVEVGYYYTLGVFIDLEGNKFVYCSRGSYTGVDELMNGKAVAGVRYFNMAGQEMTEANGVTIVVTTYTDGTTSAVKVMK